jgi:hypothetical protein
MSECKRRPGEPMQDYLGRFSIRLAEAALIARERGEDHRAAFFAIKASETLQLAKALGYSLPTPPSAHKERT